MTEPSEENTKILLKIAYSLASVSPRYWALAVKLATTVDLDSNPSISGSVTYNSTGGTKSTGQITGTLVSNNSFTVDGKNYPLKMKTPLNKEKDPREKVKDTIRVSNKYKPGDYVEEFELEDAVKKQTGKFPQLSVQDYSKVKKDKKGNYVTKL